MALKIGKSAVREIGRSVVNYWGVMWEVIGSWSDIGQLLAMMKEEMMELLGRWRILRWDGR